MLKNKVVSLLKTFSRTDLHSFGKYLRSPFFNESESIIQLFEILSEMLRQNGSAVKQLSKQDVWKKLNGSLPYQDAPFRRLCSDLNKHAYSFLALQAFKQDEVLEQNTLLKSLDHTALEKHFTGVVRQIHSIQEKNGHRGMHFHFQNYLTEYSRHEHTETLKKKVTELPHLGQADYHLDCFYIAGKLRNYCDLLGYQTVFTIDTEIPLFPSFLEFVQQSLFLEEPVVKAFYLVAKMFLQPEEEAYFNQLKGLLKDTADKFSIDELKTLYTHLKNYSIHTKINTGQAAYFHQLFDVFGMQIDNGLILEDGIISPQNYKNIITVGLHIKAFDWVENFIQTYTDKLPKENQDNDFSYNLAKVYFHKEEYEKVIEQLREVEYKNLVYALGGKLMLLKTYFELKEYMALDSLLDSFRIYLRRNRLISRDVKQQYMNVLRFTKKLSNLAPHDRRSVDKIKSQIVNCKALAAKQWLLEKVADYE